MINQCDGCQARKPRINGVHRMSDGVYPDYMACTADRYKGVTNHHPSGVLSCLMDESLDEEHGHVS